MHARQRTVRHSRDLLADLRLSGFNESDIRQLAIRVPAEVFPIRGRRNMNALLSNRRT
jgi:hypothetical protein